MKQTAPSSDTVECKKAGFRAGFFTTLAGLRISAGEAAGRFGAHGCVAPQISPHLSHTDTEFALACAAWFALQAGLHRKRRFTETPVLMKLRFAKTSVSFVSILFRRNHASKIRRVTLPN
jgi:hypothetical protein